MGARRTAVGIVGTIALLLALLFSRPVRGGSPGDQHLVGVTSNLLVVGEKVLFAQADGSLTALEITTGKVLARVRGDYSGRLAVAGDVIVRWGDRAVAVLDATSLKVRWSAKAAGVWIDGQSVFARLDDRVARMDLATGRVIWRRPFEQVRAFVVAGGRVLVFRDRDQRWNAPKDAFDELGAYFAVLDASNGKTTSRVDYPISDDRIREVFFDGERVYLARGGYENRIEELEVLGPDGVSQGKLLPPRLDAKPYRALWGHPKAFDIGDVSFLQSGLACRRDGPCTDGSMDVRADPQERNSDGERVFGAGPLQVATLWQPQEMLRVRLVSGAPMAYHAPHLALGGASVDSAVATGEHVVVASTVGVVEGVGTAGRGLLWRYTFAPRWHQGLGCAYGLSSSEAELRDMAEVTIRQRDQLLAAAKGDGASAPAATTRATTTRSLLAAASARPASVDPDAAEFGKAVAIADNTVAVGMPGPWPGVSAAPGLVYVYGSSAAGWRLRQTLAAPGDTVINQFGSTITLSRDAMLVGAPLQPAPGGGHGTLNVFTRNGDAWKQTAELAIVGSRPQEGLGYASAISGDAIAAAAPMAANDGVDSGRVYLFRRRGDTWEREATLFRPEADPGNLFGHSVALSGELLAVGSGPGGRLGAHLYARQQGDWVWERKIDTGAGATVAMADGLLAVAPERYGHSLTEPVAVLLYRRSGGRWVEEARLTVDKAPPRDYIELGVSVAGGRVAVHHSDRGELQLFERSEGHWKRKGTHDVGGGLNRAVGLSGTSLVVAASRTSSTRAGGRPTEAPSSLGVPVVEAGPGGMHTAVVLHPP